MKKMLLIMLVFAMAGTGAFAQEHKHEPFDVLIGLNFGFGISPNVFGLFSGPGEGEAWSGNYAFTMDFGLTVDFYFLNWLSVSSGLLLHPDIYATLNRGTSSVDNITDIAGMPFCLTIPIMAHINTPRVEWLYMGVGVNINIPLFGLLDSVAGTSTKGKTFVGLPIDIGFDFVKPGRGGVRFFFRVTPEFHKNGTPVPIGFVWQIYNWKVFSREKDADGKTAYSSSGTGKSGGSTGNSGGGTGNSGGGTGNSGGGTGNSGGGTGNNNSGSTGNSGVVTSGTFTLTGIPAIYNGKYAILQSSLPIGGAQSINMATDTIILVPITNGSVSIPMWSGINTDNPIRYSGNDTATVMVTIFNLATTTSSFDVLSPLPLSQIKFNSVTFSKGGATKSWSQGQVQQ